MARTNFNGWIKVQRKLMNWEFYDDAKAVKLFVHLLLCAVPESCVIDGVNLEAGEMKTSYRGLAKTLNYSVQEIRTYLDKLTNSKTIEIKTKRSYSIIRLTKYNSYQKSNTQSNTPKAPQIGTSKGVSNTQNNTQKSNTQNNTQSNTQSNTPKTPQIGTSKGVSNTQNNTQNDTQSSTPIYNKNIKNNKNLNISSSSVVVSEEEEEEILKKLKIRFFYENVKNYEQEAEEMLQYWKQNDWKQNNGNKINVRRLPKFQWRPRNEVGRDWTRFLPLLANYLKQIGKYEDTEYLRLYKCAKYENNAICITCTEQFREDMESNLDCFKKAFAAEKMNELDVKKLFYKII